MEVQKDKMYVYFNENGELVELKEKDKECYFCGFNMITHNHHIIRRCDGGSDRQSNLIDLCPNHHSLIHSGKYILGFKLKYCYLKKRDESELIPPFKFDKEHIRKLPLTEIKYNKNLIIEGDINHKANIIIKDWIKEKEVEKW